MLCDSLDGWDGAGGGREVQEGGDMCILMADSHCCMAETNTTMESNYLSIKNKFKNFSESPIKVIPHYSVCLLKINSSLRLSVSADKLVHFLFADNMLCNPSFSC